MALATGSLRLFRRAASCSTRNPFRRHSAPSSSYPPAPHACASYMCVVPDACGVPRVILRHAVPNSPDRIKMIGAALKSCKFSVKRLRMLSLLTRHGFNEEEAMFVDQQRYFESQPNSSSCSIAASVIAIARALTPGFQASLWAILIGSSRNSSASACRQMQTPSSTGQIRARPTTQYATRWPG